MKFKIGVFGSAENNKDEVVQKARVLGDILGKQKVILITGASTGLPHEATESAAKHGAEIWGYSPTTSLGKQKELFPQCDPAIYSKLFYIPKNYEFANDYGVCKKYRNVTSTANCDAGIIISGRWGSLNEFTNLYDMGKVIGVLTNTGGIADELPMLYKKIAKQSQAKVFFNKSPMELVRLILDELNNKH